jgi:hypothetical protein
LRGERFDLGFDRPALVLGEVRGQAFPEERQALCDPAPVIDDPGHDASLRLSCGS